MKKIFFTLCVSTLAILVADAQTVTRGPYLQFPTSSSMKVMWRTDSATPSRVYYGPTLATVMDNQIEDAMAVINHTVNITGLETFTEYYFAVSDGSTVLAGADDNHKFRTSPEIGTVQPISAWFIGDFGKGNDKQMDVKNSFLEHIDGDFPDMWCWLGDNVYQDGTDQEYSEKVFGDVYGYQELFTRIPFMACPGNHDYGSVLDLLTGANPPDHDGPYYDIVDVPTNGEMGGVPSDYELYYSFDYGNVHFMSLNSEIGSVTPLQPSWDWTGTNPIFPFNGSPFIDWINADLQANDKPWVVAYIHQPPFTDGSHESGAFYEVYMQAVRENILPILESYGVDVLLAGHSHVYERSYLLHDFYGLPADFVPAQHVVDGSSGKLSEGTPYVKYFDGPTPNEGTLYIVQGNSGSSETAPTLAHPAMYYGHGCDTCVGSTMIQAFGDTLSGYYLSKDGEILDDWTIIKKAYPNGIDEVSSNESISDMKVFPNPFTNETTCTFDVSTEIVAGVELLDLTGRKIHTFFNGKMSSGTKKFVINALELALAKGSYMIRVASGKRPVVERLIKVE
ncbi:MAG: metallophosphoesterase [Flavobacteriales bacterium]|nr:metallophosphoesterase [Flavobacteriales bacterium]